MVVNLKTSNILLLSIPRDYYIKINSKGAYDKLTHISLYGSEEAADSIGSVLDVDVDYYVKFNFTTLDEVVESLKGKPVYFTLDLDVLDPSEFPATGTPEAGGVSYKELIKAINKVMSLNVVGLDMVELSPTYDSSGISTALACKLVREILLQL